MSKAGNGWTKLSVVAVVGFMIWNGWDAGPTAPSVHRRLRWHVIAVRDLAHGEQIRAEDIDLRLRRVERTSVEDSVAELLGRSDVLGRYATKDVGAYAMLTRENVGAQVRRVPPSDSAIIPVLTDRNAIGAARPGDHLVFVNDSNTIALLDTGKGARAHGFRVTAVRPAVGDTGALVVDVVVPRRMLEPIALSPKRVSGAWRLVVGKWRAVVLEK